MMYYVYYRVLPGEEEYIILLWRNRFPAAQVGMCEILLLFRRCVSLPPPPYDIFLFFLIFFFYVFFFFKKK